MGDQPTYLKKVQDANQARTKARKHRGAIRIFSIFTYWVYFKYSI